MLNRSRVLLVSWLLLGPGFACSSDQQAESSTAGGAGGSSHPAGVGGPGGEGDAAECATGQEQCPTGCAVLAADPTNCGQCSVACAPGESCVNGVCTSGSSGTGGAGTGVGGSGTGGDQGVGGSGTGGADDCTVPPPASELVGWATVNGSTTGGGDATPVTVTTLSELQNAASGTSPAVIYVQGVLPPGELSIGSNKTIAGVCGAEIHGRMVLDGAQNVIIRNIKIVGYAVGDCSLDPTFDASEGCSSGYDAISVLDESNHIWFDHCDISDGTDGNLDITNGSNYVTVSWTRFHYTPRTDNVGADSTGSSGHRYSNLIGGTDSPSSHDDANSLNVTWHHNWWADNVRERQPRVRFGQNHIFNNLYTSNSTNYCVRAGIEANLLIEANCFDGVDTPHEFNSSSNEATAYITAIDNVYDACSGEQATGGGGTPFTNPPYAYSAESAAAARDAVIRGAGPQ